MDASKYTKMQKDVYESISDGMVVENHRNHDLNPDYWGVLLKDIEKTDTSKKIFEFGCGCGRNIINILKKGYQKVDGCDISQANIKHTREEIIRETGNINHSELYVTDGTGIDRVPSDKYDFVFSTIVMQHICVYDIRFKILQDKYRILKVGGILSFQMGYDPELHDGYKINYYDNYVDAENTNGFFDCCVRKEREVVADLDKINFKNITTQIRPPWDDGHTNWIFIRAEK